MKKLFFALVGVVMMASSAFAQNFEKNIYGVRAGMNVANMSVQGLSPSSKVGFHVAGVYQRLLMESQPLYLETGLQISQKGFKMEFLGGKQTVNPLYLEMENLAAGVPESVMGVKEYECTVISNKNVATFIKEFKVQLPKGAHMDFIPGSYAQIKIPTFTMDYDKDIDKSLIGDEYLPAWKKFNMFSLKCVNPEPTIRAYSMANYPAEGDVFMLTVRIATPPFKPDRSGFMDVNPGIASSYIFTLKPGDKVLMSGPYGDFHPIFDSKKEMIWVGGGAGMAPLRAQIMHMTRTLNTHDREMHYFYGARALNEVFYLQDFLQLEKDFSNFHFHLALDRPDPAADAAGVKYTPGFVHQVMYETYLKDHEAPEDIEYYMCGPGPMSNAVVKMLDGLGVDSESIMYDNFGG